MSIITDTRSELAADRAHATAYLQAIEDELAQLIHNGWCGREEMARLLRLARRGLLLDIDPPGPKGPKAERGI